MRFKVLGTGSKGNCYLLVADNGETLIVEAGINPVDIKKGIDYNLEMVAGVIVTHGHQDHCKAINHLAASGLTIHASKGTLEETSMIEHHRARIMQPLKPIMIGSFKVIGYPITHDTKEPFGFLISHKESGVICFLTDTVYSSFKFKNISHFITEANYDEDIIDAKGGDNKGLRNRIIQSHMSIQTLEEMLESNDLSKTRSIVLTHLSDRNSNQHTAKEKIQSRFGKETHIADKGMDINLNLTPF